NKWNFQFEHKLFHSFIFFFYALLLTFNRLHLLLKKVRKKYDGKICIVQKFPIHLHRI
ncbi:hypothetical protein BACCELL_04187, partial [Bacteroides cellulosilyticus DSM 14838]